MRCGQENSASGLSLADNVRCSWSAENAILADQQLLDTIRSSNLSNELDNFWVPVSSITTNDEESSLSSLRDSEEDRCDKGLGVVWLLENSDLLSQSRSSGLLVVEWLQLYGLDVLCHCEFVTMGISWWYEREKSRGMKNEMERKIQSQSLKIASFAWNPTLLRNVTASQAGEGSSCRAWTSW